MEPEITLRLPRWISGEGDGRTPLPGTDEGRMDLALRLAERNVREGTGGPFGACVVESGSGRLVSAGVNVVVAQRCSAAHAEALALMLAQRSLGTHDLGAPGLPALELVTSAQPCIQCYGMLWWSGIRRLVIGARARDVEELAGFVEGPLPDRWAERLAHRPPLPPVEVVRDVRRGRARSVLRAYRDRGGPIYNPGGK